MHFSVLLWIPMDFYEFQWTSLDFNEFQIISIDSKLISMRSDGYQCTPLDSIESQCITMNFYRFRYRVKRWADRCMYIYKHAKLRQHVQYERCMHIYKHAVIKRWADRCMYKHAWDTPCLPGLVRFHSNDPRETYLQPCTPQNCFDCAYQNGIWIYM